MPRTRLTAALVASLMTTAGAAPGATAPPEARVIVQFKPDSTLALRLAARTRDLAAERQALASRAAALGARRGIVLTAGAAVGEHAQVVGASGMDSAALAARLAADPRVEYAVPDRRVRRLRVPDDPLYRAGGAGGPASGQWYLRPPSGEVRSAVNAEAAWDLTTGDAGVVVAVLDTGVRFDHPDLAGQLLPGYDMIADPVVANDGGGRDADASDPGDWVSADEAAQADGPFGDCEEADSSWHGTAVAGLVAAATDNALGMAGTGWSTRVLPVRVLGKCFGRASDIAAGMRWAAGLAVPGVPANPNPAKVLNLSLGAEGGCDSAYASAVNDVVAAGRIVVAAAGNGAGHAVGAPANCPGVIGVVALRHLGTKVGFSDLGSQVAIAAPGGNCVNLSGACLYPLLTTTNAGTTTPVAGSAAYTDSFDASVGTSFASPIVAGVAALMVSVRPALTAAEARAAMQATARAFPFRGAPDDTAGGPVTACTAPSGVDQLQCYCSTALCGAGMLDAPSAVAAAFGLVPQIALSSAPRPGELVTLSATTSTAPSGRAIVAVQWSLVDGGGIVDAFASADNADSVGLLPRAAGQFSVRLQVTDDQGLTAAAERTIEVAAAPPPPPPPPDDGGGGGGGVGAGWVLALAALTAWLRRRPA